MSSSGQLTVIDQSPQGRYKKVNRVRRDSKTSLMNVLVLVPIKKCKE